MENRHKRVNPKQDALVHIVTCRDKPFLEERFIDSFKGRGLFTNKTIKPSAFVVEYRGKIFPHKDRRSEKTCSDALNGFLYEFSWNGEQWCVDASKEDKTLGRLVNDDHISPNCEMKKIVYEGKPHLCLFAVEEIPQGEEITYNYGDSSYPWRSKKSHDGSGALKKKFHPTSSTPKKKKVEDSCSDDDSELPGPSHDGDRSVDLSSQQDIRDSSSCTELDSQETIETSMFQLNDASSVQEDAKPGSSSEDHDSDRDDRFTEVKLKGKIPSFTNKNYCYVCGKGMKKIARHLLKHIDEEPEIAEVFDLPKNSAERKSLLAKLRNRGNYTHNQEVLRSNTGALKVRRRLSRSDVTGKKFGHCLYCKIMLYSRDMSRHVAKCAKQALSAATRGETSILGEITESKFLDKFPSEVREMLSSMKQDEITFLIQHDYLLVKMAQSLMENCGNNPSNHERIRQKLRQMGRLLLKLHEVAIICFEAALKPRNFYKVVAAVRDLAGFDENKQKYNKPSLASFFGSSLKKLANLVVTQGDSNKTAVRDANTFITLCGNEWKEPASHKAASSSSSSSSGSKVHGPSTIPFTRDIQAFYTHLEKTSASAIESMKMYESPQVYNALCKVILAQVSVLNKCAPEVSKVTLKSFQERDETTQVLSKHFIRINIMGKAGQNIAVLLTSQLISALTLLVSKRAACGVHKDNPFLFAKPDGSSTSLYHGGHCIRAYSGLCSAQNPEHLTLVHFHKHIARIFQILYLENDELDHLAKLLGRDIQKDRDYYRQPEAAVELAKIAKLLLAMEKGSLERFEGNSLDEIEIEDELEPDMEQGNPEVDCEESDFLPQQSADVEQRGGKITPEQDALQHIKACKDKPFLKEKFIDSTKGRGVFTSEAIEPSTFIVEYRGNISTRKETQEKTRRDTLKDFLFDFTWNGTNWRVDASAEDGTLGRLVNDDHTSPNCKMKKIVHEGTPHLCLFALKKIRPGEEITYNYGRSSYTWRSTVEDSAEEFSSAECFSDEDYVCEGEPSSDDKKHQKFRENADSSKQYDDASDSDESDSDPKSKKTSFTNKNYCYICGRPQTKISRHLFTHRKEVPEIAEVYAMRRNSKERKKQLELLRNRGNFKHNQGVLKDRQGKLKVGRKSQSSTLKSFATCLYCKGLYDRKLVWRHMQKCPSMASAKLPEGVQSQILTLVAATGLTDPEQISSGVKTMLKKMKKDDISSVVWEDPYILQLAQCFYYMNEKKQNQGYVTQKLRQMARVLMALREKSINSFDEAAKPQNFSALVEAVREIAGAKEGTTSFDKPSLIWKLGNSLKKIADIKYARAVKEDADKEAIEEAEAFIKLCAKEWPTHGQLSKVVGQPALEFTREVLLLHQCLRGTTASAVESLTLYAVTPVYNALIRPTLAFMSFFNKNNQEVSMVTLQSFKERDSTELQEDAAASQSQFEQILSKHTVKISVVSKSGKKLALTLTPQLLHALTLLVDKRDTCGVVKDNPFLFAKPGGKPSDFYQANSCVGMFIRRSGAKNQEGLRSQHFRKHIVRIFQILSLTNDELVQLAQLLGRDIQTDRKYYQTPEAAGDIAKILELLSAVENGSLDRYEGKTFEEIEIPDKLQPFAAPVTPGNSDAEEDNEGPESSRQQSGKKSKSTSVRKRGQRKSRKKESEEEQPEANTEKSEAVNTEKEDRTEKSAPNKPEEKQPHSNLIEPSISFSDDDEDMNVNFDIDIDTDGDDDRPEDSVADDDRPEDSVADDDRPEDSVADGRSNSSAAKPEVTGEDVTAEVKKSTEGGDGRKKEGSPNEHSGDGDLEETMETEDHVDEDYDEDDGLMDVDSDGSAPTLCTEKKTNLSVAATGMKRVKIVIPKLDIQKLRYPIHISQLSSLSNKQPVEVKPTRDDKKAEAPPPLTKKPSYAKAVHMNCSHCRKSMARGQTAYQKKGFTDVFCSKNCLFEMFSHNKPATKTCHSCQKAILQPLDLIMAAVDTKGTMKDFCSPACLCSFKYNSASTKTPKSVCNMCDNFCNTKCELTLNEIVVRFCSHTCLDDFCKNNMSVCENCSCACRSRPLSLRLEDAPRSICSAECLKEFKEKTRTLQRCTMCLSSRPVSDMIDVKNDENVVELFCSRHCVTSYKLRPTVQTLQVKTRTGSQPKEMNTEDVRVHLALAANENDEAAVALEPDSPVFLIIADLPTSCFNCKKKLVEGETLFKLKGTQECFCSMACLREKHRDIKSPLKKCHNCFQVITRPQNIILAPVDHLGTMKELCSNACLSSVTSKMKKAARKLPPQEGPSSPCRMCGRHSSCKFTVTLDGAVHRVCSDACFTSYCRATNLRLPLCDVCGGGCSSKHLVVKMEDGSKTLCSDECLVKFKEKVDTPQLCPMCQTSHRLSDMIEDKNDESRLEFFCSNRCMMVYKSQTFTMTEKKSSSSPVHDVTDVKPSLLNLDCIKEEPIDEGYSQSLLASVSPQDIKVEPIVAKEDLKIGSVFSLTGESKPAEPSLTSMDLPASCSACKKALIDGETVYQRKNHTGIFCSTSCLLRFYQKKAAGRTCHFCLQVIAQPQNAIQAVVDDEGTKNDFCGHSCLSSFNYKRHVSVKIPVLPVSSHSQCSMCSRYCISKHEITQDDVIHKICSEPCFLRFCSMNNIAVCANCHSHRKTPLTLKVEEGSRKLCSAECLAQFKQKIKPSQPCRMCHSTIPASDMVENKNSENEVELFCSRGCVTAFKIQAVSTSGASLNCDHCGTTAVPACHLSMSDASIRNFCTLKCAMTFKESQNQSGFAEKTQTDLLKPPPKLLCTQCQRNILTTPKVIQRQEKINFACSVACFQEFKRVNGITATCEYCRNERIIKDVKRISSKDCCFCSDACKTLFCQELEGKWGKHCRSCAYCLSISKTLVTAPGDDGDIEFCSAACCSKHKMLLSHVAKCDACSHKGKLKQRLPLLGEVKYFCGMKCLLHFCSNKVRMLDGVSSAPGSAAESAPVIGNVISLADALARQRSTSAASPQLGSITDIQTKVIGHVSVQTVPKELKNKSITCTPLVHNKGVSCTEQSLRTEPQKDSCDPTVVVLPVPVPVYVPVPMNMYSQYAPQPLGLPLPLPVPVVLPHGSEPTVKSIKESLQPERLEGELNMRPETEQRDTEEREDGQEEEQGTEEEERAEPSSPKDHTSSCSNDSHTDDQAEDFFNTSVGLLSQPKDHKTSPPVSGEDMPSSPLPDLSPLSALGIRETPQRSPIPPPDPPLDKDRNKDCELEQLSEKAEETTPETTRSEVTSAKKNTLKSQCGVDSWKRWIRWRGSHTSLDSVSTHAVTLKEDLLRCSAAELSDCLCCFIREVKRSDGEPYSPDRLLYLCLSIQLHLFQNGRLENIFSDLIYHRFSSEFTKILKQFKPAATAGGWTPSCVEEDFLWDCKQLGAYSPVVLLNTLLFFFCKCFGFTTVEQHRQLSFAHVTLCSRTSKNNSKTTFLRFHPPSPANQEESDTYGVPAKKRKKNESEEDFLEMVENLENPLRCPVRLYEFYLSKCPGSVRQRSDLFYLQPDRSCVPSSPLWFLPAPLNDTTMEAVMMRILAVRELQGGCRGGAGMAPWAVADPSFTPNQDDSQ